MDDISATRNQPLELLVERILQDHPSGKVLAHGSESGPVSNCVLRLTDRLGVCIVRRHETEPRAYSVFRISGGPSHILAFEDGYRAGIGSSGGLTEPEVLNLLECYLRINAECANVLSRESEART